MTVTCFIIDHASGGSEYEGVNISCSSVSDLVDTASDFSEELHRVQWRYFIEGSSDKSLLTDAVKIEKGQDLT